MIRRRLSAGNWRDRGLASQVSRLLQFSGAACPPPLVCCWKVCSAVLLVSKARRCGKAAACTTTLERAGSARRNHYILSRCTLCQPSPSQLRQAAKLSAVARCLLMRRQLGLKWIDTEVGRHFRVGLSRAFRGFTPTRISTSVKAPRGDASPPRYSGLQMAGPGGCRLSHPGTDVDRYRDGAAFSCRGVTDF